MVRNLLRVSSIFKLNYSQVRQCSFPSNSVRRLLYFAMSLCMRIYRFTRYSRLRSLQSEWRAILNLTESNFNNSHSIQVWYDFDIDSLEVRGLSLAVLLLDSDNDLSLSIPSRIHGKHQSTARQLGDIPVSPYASPRRTD